MCSVGLVLGGILLTGGMYAKSDHDQRKAEKRQNKQAERLERLQIGREDVTSDSADDLEIEGGSFTDKRRRKRLGKRSLRSVGLSGIETNGSPEASAAPIGLGGI